MIARRPRGEEPASFVGRPNACAQTFDPGSAATILRDGHIHRRHLTTRQKHDIIATLLKATPDQSNRQIAESVKVSHHTVGDVRAKLESTGQIAQLDRTVGKDKKARKSKPKPRFLARRHDLVDAASRLRLHGGGDPGNP